jgi:hypothetical protein
VEALKLFNFPTHEHQYSYGLIYVDVDKYGYQPSPSSVRPTLSIYKRAYFHLVWDVCRHAIGDIHLGGRYVMIYMICMLGANFVL